MVRNCFGLFKMPSYYTLTTKDYDFYVEPIGIRKYLKFLQYLSGGFLRFDLFAYDKYTKGVSLKYEWKLLRLHAKRYSEYDNKNGMGYFDQYAQDRNWTLWSQLIIPEVSASGQYKLQLEIIDKNGIILEWATIVGFEQLSRDRVIFNLMMAGIGILGVIIGGIIGWVLKG